MIKNKASNNWFKEIWWFSGALNFGHTTAAVTQTQWSNNAGWGRARSKAVGMRVCMQSWGLTDISGTSRPCRCILSVQFVGNRNAKQHLSDRSPLSMSHCDFTFYPPARHRGNRTSVYVVWGSGTRGSFAPPLSAMPEIWNKGNFFSIKWIFS